MVNNQYNIDEEIIQDLKFYVILQSSRIYQDKLHIMSLIIIERKIEILGGRFS